MKKKIIISVTILLLAFTNAYAQLTYPPISVGDLLERPNYTHTGNTADYPMGYFHHAIILPVPMDVSISHCGSTLSSSDLSLYDNSLNLIARGSSAAQDGCSNGNLKYLRMNNLAAGTYFVKSEFTNFNAQIKVSINSSPGINPVGNTRTNPINVGQKSNSFIYTDTKNTNDFSNDYNGQPTNDVFYRLSITIPMDVEISHYGSVLRGTFLHLLNENGNRIADNNDYTGPGGGIDHPHSYLKMTNLAAGVYYIVSEGFNSNGSITTTIQGTAWDVGGENNHVLTITPTVATSDVSTLPADGALRTYQYFDGLGRPMQTVQQRGTPDKFDLVSYQEYDIFGRESNSWLPAKAATNTGAFVPLATVMTRSAATYADPKAYSRVEYEASLLNRVASQTGPGADWHYNGKKVATEYLANNATYVCRWFRASDTRTNSQVSITSDAVNYPDGQLYVTKLTDEDGNDSYEFKNKLGQVLLTRQMEGSVAHDTYYVYDLYGNLRAVLPPLAADAMTAAGSWSETHATIKDFAYLYKYDGRNRCIAKKLPGAEWVYYVYDYAGQLIFTQDGEMRAKTPKQWMFSIPDIFGRVALTGTCTNEMDYAANPLGNNVVRAMRYYGNNPYNGHAVVGTGLSNPVILSTAYYDNYGFMGSNGMPYSTDADFKYEPLSGYGTQYTGGYKGLLTGTINAQMNADGVTTSYLYSVMYYDDRGRVIQTKSSNQLAGGVDKEYIGYNFSGQPVKRRLVHSATGKTTQTQLYEYVYDHAGRLTQVKHGLNTSTAGTVIALNTYDDLGRLKTQKKGSLPVTTYGYNVRSWTKSISNNTLFNQTLYYNESYGGSAKKYGGNVSAMSWKVGSETLQGYSFAYDGLSRLKSASYLINGAVNSNNSVSGITYDKHGNMKTIQRRGKTTASAYGVIDNLTMTHQGNQLTGVSDAGTTVTIAESNDFKKGSTAATQYTYNKNGAMSKDLNKSISAVSYNLLNLPAQVMIGGVAHKYTYSADGRKLRVEQGSTNRDYVGSVIYENGSLKRVLIDGGYIEGGTYYYYLNDHLGNTRVVASGTGTVHQKNKYYPFGMPMAETGNAEQDKQPYKFGGKEFERKNGLNLYDFEARQMDPAIARFTIMDPLAEKYYSVSPYAYCGNNPVNYVDPTGKEMNPIYDTQGNFLGTDALGLQGDAIFMDPEDFVQGMSNEEALKYDLGEGSLVDSHAVSRFKLTQGSLYARPDYDGFVTIDEGVQWAKEHPGALQNPTPLNALYANAALLDFGSLSVAQMGIRNVGIMQTRNLFNQSNTVESLWNPTLRSTVYALGQVHMVLENPVMRTVRIVNGSSTVYDWDRGGSLSRQIGIERERLVRGLNDSHGFHVYYYGIGVLRR